MSTAAATAERLLCDTSFVGFSARRASDPERFSHWPAETVERIDRAILAISVITLAEARYGYLHARWGRPLVTCDKRSGRRRRPPPRNHPRAARAMSPALKPVAARPASCPHRGCPV